MPNPIFSARDLDDPSALAVRPLLSVPLWKIAVLSGLTFGVYNYVWFYRQWKRQASVEACSPVLRTIFSVLFYYSLGRGVRGRQLAAEIRPTATAGWLAVVYFLFIPVGRLPDPYWIGAVLSFLPLLVTQSEINRLNVAVGSSEPVDGFRWPAWVAAVAGLMLWCLALIAVLLPEAV